MNPGGHCAQGLQCALLPSLKVPFLHSLQGTSWRPPKSSNPQLGVISRPVLVHINNIKHKTIESNRTGYTAIANHSPAARGHSLHVEVLWSQKVSRSRHFSECPIVECATVPLRSRPKKLLWLNVPTNGASYFHPRKKCEWVQQKNGITCKASDPARRLLSNRCQPGSAAVRAWRVT